MTDQEMNAAIAEACGEEYHKPTDQELKSGSYYQYEPDYLNDLNAMASAEDTLSDEQWDIYSTWLCITTDYKTSRLRAHELIRAKARERAEAFLRTIGKWTR